MFALTPSSCLQWQHPLHSFFAVRAGGNPAAKESFARASTLRFRIVVVSDVDPTGDADHEACTAFAATIVALNAAFVWGAFVTTIVALNAAKTTKKATFAATLRFRIVVVSDVDPPGDADHV
jgi:hypothetical protein